MQNLKEVLHRGGKLDSTDIKSLIKDGHKLDSEKTHIARFMFNDKINQAVNPRPFKVPTEHIDDYRQDAIGMPFIVIPKAKNHLFVDQRDNESTQDIVLRQMELQKDFAVGTIRSTFKTPANNVFGIIEIFPDYVKDIDKFPAHVSPSFAVGDYRPIPGEGAEEIHDAKFVNLQGVPNGGYESRLTGIKGTCRGSFTKCSRELALVGAAGKTKDARSNGNLSLNTINQYRSDMSEQTTTGDNAGGDAGTDASMIKSGFDKINQRLDATDKQLVGLAGIVKQLGEKTGVDVSMIGGGEPPAKDAGMTGAAGNKDGDKGDAGKDTNMSQQLTDQDKKIKALEKQLKTKDDEAYAAKRQSQAKNIVNAKLKLGMIKKEDAEKTVTELVELKDGDVIVDLSLTEKTLGQQVELLEGSSQTAEAATQQAATAPKMFGASGKEDQKYDSSNAALMEGL